MTGNKRSTIDPGIGQAADLFRVELVASWRKLIMSPRSKGIRGFVLARAYAIRIHIQAHGGFKSTARERFLAIAEPGDIAKPIPPAHHDVSNAGQEDSQRHCRTDECCP